VSHRRTGVPIVVLLLALSVVVITRSVATAAGSPPASGAAPAPTPATATPTCGVPRQYLGVASPPAPPAGAVQVIAGSFSVQYFDASATELVVQTRAGQARIYPLDGTLTASSPAPGNSVAIGPNKNLLFL